MRWTILVLWALLSATSAMGQVSVGIALPGISIGINVPVYPELVRVPGYPVYYAPRLGSNFFFYDGMYWVYQGDDWYASSWYNGPWRRVSPEVVPVFLLRVPVRYYRNPPGYFRAWRPDAPPRWGEHWGNDWEQHRRGWDQWDRKSVPAPAPLPVYQRQYSGSRYPSAEQQPVLHARNYHYQPHEAVARQHYQDQANHAPPAPSRQAAQQAPVARSPGQHDPHPSAPPHEERRVEQEQARQPHQGAAAPEQQMPHSGPDNAAHGKGAPHEPGQGQGQGQDHEQGEERGQEHKK